MSFTKLEFTKDWTNPEDFPTFEDREEQVRADMQLLFNECRDGVNRLAGEIRAESVPFKRTPEIDAVTVQNALEVVQGQIAGALLGALPDASIRTVKLADGAVTEPKLASAAVTEEKLSESAVTAKKLAAGAVETEKIADGAVTPEKIPDGSLGLEKLVPGTLDGKADLDGSGKVLPEQTSRAIVHAAASRALEPEDAGRLLLVSGTADVCFTVPVNSEIPFPVGTEIQLYRAGEGQVRLEGAEDVTLLADGEELSVPGQYGCLRMKKLAVNTWSVEGAAGSVGNPRLSDASVTTEKLRDAAVTYEKTRDIQRQHRARTALLELDGWGEDNRISVRAEGVTEDNTVVVSPDPDSWSAYAESGVRCVAQGEDSLTFMAENVPEEDVTVNLLILNK